ncbi:Gfo/Idh/MocA family oxidoreductase [Segetibacter sp.]|uniref:Gfo/Idh/MocA family protein n=1 Tax=Segetibacter sp. TaxID=2231182 RepID=UPI00261442E7|nr:Gfo/Idh/MocA family oxidoreductase [Segetibacter sp.]MCW3081730.1 Gfo/Idh/MocA family oxidoreductase [Segetibacter sp.]
MKLCKIIFRIFTIFLSLHLVLPVTNAQTEAASSAPLRLAIAGISHGHVGWILGRKKPDVTLVGIYEPNKELAERNAKEHHLDPTLFYTDLTKMLEAVKPEAVSAFGSIKNHLAAVEACAPRGIHVMVEKPLTFNNQDAKRMQELANKNHIYLLTNYETSWYPSTEKTFQLVTDSNYVGPIRKVVFHHGHEGPKKIGVQPEFFNILTDPAQNGGGAIVDFGCYGANIMTYLMKDQEPISVTAITSHFQPAIYPRVDDEATIVVTYPNAQCIIQASWNWPFARKDMEVYGETGYIIATNNNNMRLRNTQTKGEQTLRVTTKEVPVYTDPFSYMADVVRGKIKVQQNGLYSLENNIKAVKILDAARESAKTGKTVLFNK